MLLNGVKGCIAYIMFNTTGIFGGCLYVNAKLRKQLGKQSMTFIYALCVLFAGLGKTDEAVLIPADITVIREQPQSPAY